MCTIQVYLISYSTQLLTVTAGSVFPIIVKLNETGVRITIDVCIQQHVPFLDGPVLLSTNKTLQD